jgi:hypothetical protein
MSYEFECGQGDYERECTAEQLRKELARCIKDRDNPGVVLRLFAAALAHLNMEYRLYNEVRQRAREAQSKLTRAEKLSQTRCTDCPHFSLNCSDVESGTESTDPDLSQ